MKRADRNYQRHCLLKRTHGSLADGRITDAIKDLILVVELLSLSEERVTRLHAECASMLEQAGKILELDASLRPVIVQLPLKDDLE